MTVDSYELLLSWVTLCSGMVIGGVAVFLVAVRALRRFKKKTAADYDELLRRHMDLLKRHQDAIENEKRLAEALKNALEIQGGTR